jgi:hypothetical protein
MTANYSKLPVKIDIDKLNYANLILDSQFETLFNSITELTSRVCEVPAALIVLVNNESILVQYPVGHTISHVLQDRKHFSNIFTQDMDYFESSSINLNTIGESQKSEFEYPEDIFFAGAKIKLPLGEMIGVLCVFDISPRTLSSMQREYLTGMANVIEKAFVISNSIHNLT